MAKKPPRNKRPKHLLANAWVRIVQRIQTHRKSGFRVFKCLFEHMSLEKNMHHTGNQFFFSLHCLMLVAFLLSAHCSIFVAGPDRRVCAAVLRWCWWANSVLDFDLSAFGLCVFFLYFTLASSDHNCVHPRALVAMSGFCMSQKEHSDG